MSDIMMFPKTVDEFMEQYKIVDSDEVYTNGAELIPIFRMKQWFEHIDTEPVRHGHWVIEEHTNSIDGSSYKRYKCSECGCPTAMFIRSPYCSNCGARMDKN